MLILILLNLISCKTLVEVPVYPDLNITDLTTFRPSEDLDLKEVKTTKDLLNNSLQFEKSMYAWKIYAILLEKQINGIRLSFMDK